MILYTPLDFHQEHYLLVAALAVLRTCDRRYSDAVADLACENSHMIFSIPKSSLVMSLPHANTCFPSLHMPMASILHHKDKPVMHLFVINSMEYSINTTVLV